MQVRQPILRVDDADFSQLTPEDCQYFLNGYPRENRAQITIAFLNEAGQEQTIQLRKKLF